MNARGKATVAWCALSLAAWLTVGASPAQSLPGMSGLSEHRIGFGGSASGLLEPPRDPCPDHHPPGSHDCAPGPDEECWFASPTEYLCRPSVPPAACAPGERRAAGGCCPADTAWAARERHCRPVALLSRCAGGALDACSAAGEVMAFSASRPTRDEARARVLFRRACDGGVGRACERLAFLWGSGLGGPRDDARAIALHGVACESGDAHGCFSLGFAYESGVGVAADAGRAFGFYRRSCEGGDTRGCANLGLLYESGRGVAQDAVVAVEFFRRACNGGSRHGCANLGVAYANGRGVARDVVRARELLQRACRGGLAEACPVLRQLPPAPPSAPDAGPP